MPRRKPLGWPKLMVARRLAGGATAYYWVPPTHAAAAGCPIVCEALGTDYGEAKRRCDEVLNPNYDEWRTGKETSSTDRIVIGTFSWLLATYFSSPRFRELPAKTRKSYENSLRLVSDYTLKDGRKLGALSLSSITPGVADRLYEKLKLKSDGTERVRTANLAMAVCKRAWNVARRDRPDQIPLDNPFTKMGLTYKAQPTRPVTYAELMRFVAAADAAGEASIGTAAMIAFYWLQRQQDILTRLSWAHYRPADAPDKVRIFHHKTGAVVEHSLFDDDGSHYGLR
jgi:hypothetical protein